MFGTESKYAFIVQAAGQGIDGLQHVCAHAVFVEWSWVPGEINQAMDRIHRIGQRESPLYQFYVVRHSIDENILKSVLEKSENIRKVIS